jgi:FMN phosphatase YigB (HAD superfamily)
MGGTGGIGDTSGTGARTDAGTRADLGAGTDVGSGNPTSSPPRDPDPEKIVLRLIIEEAKERLAKGRLVEAYDWDDIVTCVAENLARKAQAGSPPPLDVAALVRYYCGLPDMIALLPGAREALSSLKQEGYTLGVVTNGYRRYQLPVLQALGIDGFFDAIVTPEEIRAAKPEARIFQAAWGSSLTPLHVGDDPVHDVWGARSAGGYSVWLHRDLPEDLRCELPEGRPRCGGFASVRDKAYTGVLSVEAFGVPAEACVPHAVIETLEELPELLRRLKARDALANS